MSLMDPLADALTNIRNNELQVNDSCVISPASKLIGQVLSTMQKENYIGNFEYVDDNRAGKFIVELKPLIIFFKSHFRSNFPKTLSA